MDSNLPMRWLECAQLECRSSKGGVLSTEGRQSQQLRVGWSSIWTVLSRYTVNWLSNLVASTILVARPCSFDNGFPRKLLYQFHLKQKPLLPLIIRARLYFEKPMIILCLIIPIYWREHRTHARFIFFFHIPNVFYTIRTGPEMRVTTEPPFLAGQAYFIFLRLHGTSYFNHVHIHIKTLSGVWTLYYMSILKNRTLLGWSAGRFTDCSLAIYQPKNELSPNRLEVENTLPIGECPNSLLKVIMTSAIPRPLVSKMIRRLSPKHANDKEWLLRWFTKLCIKVRRLPIIANFIRNPCSWIGCFDTRRA